MNGEHCTNERWTLYKWTVKTVQMNGEHCTNERWTMYGALNALFNLKANAHPGNSKNCELFLFSHW
jgi:hypothetical protein